LPGAIRDVDVDGIFTGYASIFGSEDRARDIIKPGAFKNSIRRYGLSGIKMLWHHNPGEPIGYWLDIYEDSFGLAVRGRLLSGVSKADEVLVLLRSGAIDGLSIGFRTIKARTDKALGIRYLLEVDLWEISIVTFPMLSAARVRTIKTIKAFENTKQAREHCLIERMQRLTGTVK